MTRLGETSAGRRVHILDGDGDGKGGGHRWDSDIPGKAKFPRTWKDDKVFDMIHDVAQRPDHAPIQRLSGRWWCTGTRKGVEILVILDPDGAVRTARPERGPGVTRNPR
jgi:hypothetical protein